MTTKEKWAKHAELSARANALYVEWQNLCREINMLIMTRAFDAPKRRKPKLK